MRTTDIFGSTDAKTRFLLLQDISDRKKGADVTCMLMQCILRAGKDPVEFITDLLVSYQVAFEALLAPKNALDDHSVHIADPDSARKSKSKDTPGVGAPADISGRRAAVKCVHINDAGISKHDKKNNNGQERFNGTQWTLCAKTERKARRLVPVLPVCSMVHFCARSQLARMHPGTGRRCNDTWYGHMENTHRECMRGGMEGCMMYDE